MYFSTIPSAIQVKRCESIISSIEIGMIALQQLEIYDKYDNGATKFRQLTLWSLGTEHLTLCMSHHQMIDVLPCRVADREGGYVSSSKTLVAARVVC